MFSYTPFPKSTLRSNDYLPCATKASYLVCLHLVQKLFVPAYLLWTQFEENVNRSFMSRYILRIHLHIVQLTFAVVQMSQTVCREDDRRYNQSAMKQQKCETFGATSYANTCASLEN